MTHPACKTLRIALTLTLAAGCKQAPTPSSVQVPSTVTNWTTGETAQLQVHLADQSSLLSTQQISAQGGFSLSLPQQINPYRLILLQQWIHNCGGNVQAKPDGARIGELNFLLQIDEAFAGEIHPQLGNEGGTVVYAAQAADIEGNENCQQNAAQGSVLYQYQVHLNPGWNLVTLQAKDSQTRLVQAQPLPTSLNWKVRAVQDLHGALQGQDLGSTPTVINAEFAQHDFDEVSLMLIEPETREVADLIEPIDVKGSRVNVTLPSTVDPALLSPVIGLLNTHLDCSGPTILSAPQARYAELVVNLLQDGMVQHHAELRNYGKLLKWWYVDQNTDLTGYQACNKAMRTPLEKFQLHLKKGWNLIERHLEEGGSTQIWQTITTPSVRTWYPSKTTGGGVTPSVGFNLEGLIEGWEDENGQSLGSGVLHADLQDALHPVDSSPIEDLMGTPIHEAAFKLLLPENLLGIQVRPLGFNGVCGDMSPQPGVLGATLYLDAHSDGVVVGHVRGSKQEGKESLSFYYADQSATVTGTRECDVNGVHHLEQYNLQLNQGWNTVSTVRSSQDATHTTTLVQIGSLSGVRWTLDRSGVELSHDLGSTARLIQGQLTSKFTHGQRLEARLVSDSVEGGETLSETQVSSQGNFQLNLPDTVSAQGLAPFQGQHPDCLNTITVSDPQAKFGYLELAVQDIQQNHITDLNAQKTEEGNHRTLASDWWYVDRSVRISGAEDCREVDGFKSHYHYDLSLHSGWNVVLSTHSGLTFDTVLTTIETVPSGTLWFTNQDQIEVLNAKTN
ncbi:hypothetical protein F0U62_09795 [Cystobacter fuscus]|uniref:hypothetical protein n=1 Tax=Cystobacter fuscus TaxID=43 RepID=UPI002B2AFD5A|nr:hypothetical protein F0U62_09795 [Cystobacter fuscus]